MTYRAPHHDLRQEVDAVPPLAVGVALFITLVISAVMIILAVELTNKESARIRPGLDFPEKWLGPRRRVARVRQDVFGEHRRPPSLDTRARVFLGSYGWVNQDQGIVHIPIARAIDLVATGRQP